MLLGRFPAAALPPGAAADELVVPLVEDPQAASTTAADPTARAQTVRCARRLARR